LAALAYGHAATVWRINRGWRRRRSGADVGFVLDLERGYWASRPDATAADDGDADPMSARQQRVIPFVEDTRNCLLVERDGLPADQRQRTALMASLQAALKTAIQATFQLEDSELPPHPPPASDDRRHLLFYEAAEGGAGVLRRLLDDPDALAQVARTAIDLCHFDPATRAGVDQGG